MGGAITGVIMEYKLLCPKCSQEPSIANAIYVTPYSAERWDLIYFMCSPCRTIYIDRELIKRHVREWRDRAYSKKNMPPLKVLYKTALDYLESAVLYCVERIGYEHARFIRKKLKAENTRQ